MDDFFTSMLKETDIFQPQDNSLELQNNGNKGSSSSLFVQGLVPLNPYKWPSFIMGSSTITDMPDLQGKLGTPFLNLQVAQEYLATAQSDVQYRGRLWQVAENTVTINAMCEIGGDPSTFASGAVANKIADQYMNEMIDTEVTKNLNEKLNMEIFRATAKSYGRDPEIVRGTGTIRQNVPEYMRNDICDRPKRNERPPEWGDTNGLDEEGISAPLKPNGPPDGVPSSDSMGSSGGLGSERSISQNEISDDNYEDGRIFARFFGWLGFGTDAAPCFEQAPMSPYEIQRLREEAEDDFYLNAGGSCPHLDIDHLAYNPPMHSSENFLPPDK
jgi:hypothetical protein